MPSAHGHPAPGACLAAVLQRTHGAIPQAHDPGPFRRIRSIVPQPGRNKAIKIRAAELTRRGLPSMHGSASRRRQSHK
jgi:hypothetical protein